MFGRSKSPDTTATSPSADKPDGKGRPTPSRKQAEAAAKARAKVPRTRREKMLAQRTAPSESSKTVRAGMKAGDERYLLARDKGPVRRFIRDFVDARFSFVELMVPLLVVSLLLGYSRNPNLYQVANLVMLATVLLVAADLVILRFKLRRELARRFPEEPVKGLTYYAVMRALQMKFMRLPKAKVKIGQSLPEHYR